jgi:hypothetical protein
MDSPRVIASIDQLHLQNAVGLALLLEERIHYGAPVLTDILEPIGMDRCLERNRLVFTTDSLE